MNRVKDIYKYIFKNSDENLKEIYDKVDCLQRSQIYLHDHINQAETRIDAKIEGLKKLLRER